MADDPKDHLRHLLVEIYSLEQQALVQMRTAPEIARSAKLSQHFQEHLVETEQQAELVRDRLDAVGEAPSRIKDAVMRLGGKGFVLFARSQPDTPGKLLAHSYSYEALEFAAYELLIRVAALAGDNETERVATLIRDQEAAMRDRLATDFDEAVDKSLELVGKEPAATLPAYLADAHALEMQSVELLKRGEKISGDGELGAIYDQHRRESEAHAERIEQRLEDLGGDNSSLKDVALRAGGLNWSLFLRALEDTPAKLAAFVYAVEHLEIGGYELLRRVALRAGDSQTASLCDQILTDERLMALRVGDSLGRAVEATVVAAT